MKLLKGLHDISFSVLMGSVLVGIMFSPVELPQIGYDVLLLLVVVSGFNYISTLILIELFE